MGDLRAVAYPVQSYEELQQAWLTKIWFPHVYHQRSHNFVCSALPTQQEQPSKQGRPMMPTAEASCNHPRFGEHYTRHRNRYRCGARSASIEKAFFKKHLDTAHNQDKLGSRREITFGKRLRTCLLDGRALAALELSGLFDRSSAPALMTLPSSRAGAVVLQPGSSARQRKKPQARNLPTLNPQMQNPIS